MVVRLDDLTAFLLETDDEAESNETESLNTDPD